MSALLEPILRNLGAEVIIQPAAPHRNNVIGFVKGASSARDGDGIILLCAHQDTVSVEGMTIAPFAAAVRDGRVFGRGACDTKGGMAAAIAALGRLTQRPDQQRPTIVLACTVDEEHGFSGVKALPGLWSGGPGAVLPRKPDVAVVLEPTGLDVVVAHKGVVRWRCHAHGRAAHSSCPQAGENAIYRMAAVVAAIERYARDALSAAAAHPLCGRGTLSVGTIAGGAGVNTVPDRCTIEIDCRFPPGQSSETARQELIACLQSQGLTAGVEHEPPFLSAPALSDADNGPLAARLAACASAAGGTCRTLGVPYASEAAFLAAAGIPTVVFGPGHVEQAHTADEWVAVDEVRRAEETLYRFGIEAG